MNRFFALNSSRKNIFNSMSFLQQPKCMPRRYSVVTSKDGLNPLIELDCESIDSIAEKRKRLFKKSRWPASAIVELNFVMRNFTDKYLNDFDLAQLNIFNMLLSKAISDEIELFNWLTGVKDTPPKYQNSLTELLKNHAKEYNIKPLKTRLFDRLESLKYLKYTSDDDKNDSKLKVLWAFMALYEVGLKDTTFIDEEQKLLGNLLVDAFDPFKIDIESTDISDMLERNVIMKRAVLQFMMEDYSQFPARDSILIHELERLNIKDSIKILDKAFMKNHDFHEEEDFCIVCCALHNFREIDFRIQCSWAE